MKLFNKRIRPTGETSLFHTRADINELVKFCNALAEKVDKLVEENNRIAEEMEKHNNETESKS